MATELPEAGAPDVLYIVDLHCWMHRFYATMYGRAAHGFIEFIGKTLRNQQPAFFAVCRDLPFPTFRAALFPKDGNGDGYKAHREGPDATLIERIRWAHEMLEDVFGIPVYGRRGFEADDLIGALAQHAKNEGLRVVILGLDKDLMQLVDERCVMWDGKQRVVGPPEVEEKFGVRPDQLRDYLAIVGDGVDNVPGIHGAGPKAAVEILKEFDTLENALAAADPVLTNRVSPLYKSRPRYRDLLSSQRDVALLSQKLVTLAYDAPITFNRQELAR